MTYTNDEAMVRLTAAALPIAAGLFGEHRVIAQEAVALAAAALAELRKEHGSQGPLAVTGGVSASVGRSPVTTPTPGIEADCTASTETAQARPSSPAPSARGAGARWNETVRGFQCSKCREFVPYGGGNARPDHELACWDLKEDEMTLAHALALHAKGDAEIASIMQSGASPAVSARQDAPSSLRGEPVDIGELKTTPWVTQDQRGRDWTNGYHAGWAEARARALKMSSEPEEAKHGN
jgi:hypothetical protein